MCANPLQFIKVEFHSCLVSVIKASVVDNVCCYLWCVSTTATMLMYSVRLLLIIAIYYDAVNTINRTEFKVNTFGDTYDDLMQQLVFPTASMLCKFRSNLVHMYYDTSLQTSTAEELIFLLSKCSSLLIVRWVHNFNWMEVIYTFSRNSDKKI